MTRTMISCEGVSKHFRIPQQAPRTLKERVLHPINARTVWKEFHALNSVGFEVAQGEFFGIVGRNGSGKSTMLKILAGIYRADSGRVDINGTLASFIELGVGFNMDLSGRENLYINGALLGMSRRELKRRYDSIVEFADLGEFMDMKLRNYSSGMQVRLAFSVAIESGSDILLTDEVLAVGDERFQERCFDVFRERRKRGTTIIFVSHDMAAIERFCDRAMVLEHGTIQGIGPPPDMTAIYRELNLGPGSGTLEIEVPAEGSSTSAPNVSLDLEHEQRALELSARSTVEASRDYAALAYQLILRREASEDDITWLSNSLLLHSQSRSDVVKSIASSIEFRWLSLVDTFARSGLRARLAGTPLSDIIGPPDTSECIVEIPWVLSRIPDSGSVLDCSTSVALLPYAEALSTLDRCDVSSLDHRESTVPNVTQIHGDPRRIAVADDTFDCTICTRTLQFLGRSASEQVTQSQDHAHMEQALTELGRITRPGGDVLLCVPTGERNDAERMMFQESPEVWIDLLERSSLRVVEKDIFQLSGNGWHLATQFDHRGVHMGGVRYGTRGRFASAVLCIRATPA